MTNTLWRTKHVTSGQPLPGRWCTAGMRRCVGRNFAVRCRRCREYTRQRQCTTRILHHMQRRIRRPGCTRCPRKGYKRHRSAHSQTIPRQVGKLHMWSQSRKYGSAASTPCMVQCRWMPVNARHWSLLPSTQHTHTHTHSHTRTHTHTCHLATCTATSGAPHGNTVPPVSTNLRWEALRAGPVDKTVRVRADTRRANGAARLVTAGSAARHRLPARRAALVGFRRKILWLARVAPSRAHFKAEEASPVLACCARGIGGTRAAAVRTARTHVAGARELVRSTGCAHTGHRVVAGGTGAWGAADASTWHKRVEVLTV